MAKLRFRGLCVLSTLLLAGQVAHGQGLQTAAGQPMQVHRTTPALQYFGRGLHVPVEKRQMRPQAQPTQRFQLAGGKPFQNLPNRPTVTPYLQLDAIESSVGLPNYYSRVLPQIEQLEADEAQASELRRLQQQVRLANAPGVISNNRNGGVPTTGRSSQFMNVGSYFPPVRR